MATSGSSASRLPVPRRLLFFVFAAAIGALVGLATLGLVELIALVQTLGYGQGAESRIAQAADALPAWRIVAVPTLGGLVVGLLVTRLPERRYHGIADVMEACALNGARMPVRSGLAGALAAAVSLGVGAPLGREGPAVHIGASISAWAAERLGLDHRQSLALLGCGAAAAVAVSFNAPVAAVIFALEVIVGYYTLRVFAPVVIAAMVAMVVRQAFIGDAALFPVPESSLHAGHELIAFAGLGIAGAVVAKLLIHAVPAVIALWDRVRLPLWARPAVAGALIGTVALELPLVLGLGFEGTFAALNGELVPSMLVVLLIAKLAAVALALGSGFAGGVFGPAIYLGAMLGGVYGFGLAALLGPYGVELAQPGVYAAVGMAAVASALLGAPISTILIVFELTRDYSLTLGVMSAAAFASTFMQIGRHGSFFRWQLAHRDIDIHRGRDTSLLTGEACGTLISARWVQTDASITVGELEARMGSERQRVALFLDDDGRLIGSANLSMLIVHAIAEGMDSPAIEGALEAGYAIRPSTNIVAAVKGMAERQIEYAPVTDGQNSAVPLGVVFRADLLEAHYDVVKRAREHEFGIT